MKSQIILRKLAKNEITENVKKKLANQRVEKISTWKEVQHSFLRRCLQQNSGLSCDQSVTRTDAIIKALKESNTAWKRNDLLQEDLLRQEEVREPGTACWGWATSLQTTTTAENKNMKQQQQKPKTTTHKTTRTAVKKDIKARLDLETKTRTIPLRVYYKEECNPYLISSKTQSKSVAYCSRGILPIFRPACVLPFLQNVEMISKAVARIDVQLQHRLQPNESVDIRCKRKW